VRAFTLIWVIGISTSVWWVSNFVDNHPFQVFYHVKESKEFPFFGKTQNQRSTQLQFFQKLQRTASSPEGISGFHEKPVGLSTVI
jgi:hypothetical protein